MQKTIPPAGQQIKIDINKTLPLICTNPECGNDTFLGVMKFRIIPKLMAGTTEDRIMPFEVYTCTACGTIPEILDMKL